MPGRAKLSKAQTTTQPLTSTPRRFAALWTGLALAVLTFALYAPSLHSDFVYDARLQILSQTFLHQHEHLLEIITFRVMARDVIDYNRPIHLLSLMIDSILWGRAPFGYHLTSILLHAINTALLFALLRKWVRQYLEERKGRDTEIPSVIAAALGTAVFAVHTLSTEVVAEPSYREDSLACLFLLIALLLATGWRGAFRGRQMLIAIGILLCTLLSIGSKEIGAAVVVMLGLYWLSMRRAESTRSWLILISGSGLITLAFLIARFTLEPTNSLSFPVPPTYHGGSFASAIQLQPRVWLFYLQKLVWPSSLCADYDTSAVNHISLLAGALIVGLLVALQALGAWKNRILLLSAGLFWLTLLPVSNFLPIYRHIADRFMYTPMTGVACAVAGIVAWVWNDRLAVKAIAATICTWVICLAVISFQRQYVFSNSFLFWLDTFAKNPQSFIAATNLGWQFYESGENPSAIEYFSKAVDLTGGRLPNAWLGMALTLERMNEHERAERALGSAIRLEGRLATPEAVIGTQLTSQQAEQVRKILNRMQR